ncbi:MAG: hypothetical protein DRI01_06995, partial [Chloroflexi bacterium]
MNLKRKTLIIMAIIFMVATTPLWADPVISVDSNSIEDELNTGDVSEHVLNVANDGDALLRFTIEHEILQEPDIDRYSRILRGTDGAVGPNRDDAGDVLREYDVGQFGYSAAHGLAWDPVNEWMWVLDGEGRNNGQDRLYALDPENGEMVITANVRSREVVGLFYLDGVLHVGTFWNAPHCLFRFDTDGNELEQLELPVRPGFVTTDGEHLFTHDFDRQDGIIHVYNLDDLEEVATIDCGDALDDSPFFGMEWISAHRGGQLWLMGRLDGEDHTFQCHIDDEWNCELVQDFATPTAYGGIGYDGEDLWLGRRGSGTLWVIDDGVAGWLSYEPSEGEIDAGGDMDVIVTLDATGLVEGDYSAELTFHSNDPANPETVVSVDMHVTGAPDIETEWAEEIGFPDVIDWNQAFEDVFRGGPYDIPVMVSNAGTA